MPRAIHLSRHANLCRNDYMRDNTDLRGERYVSGRDDLRRFSHLRRIHDV